MPYPRIRLRAFVIAATALVVALTVTAPAHAKPSARDLTKQIDKASNQLEEIVESYNAMNISLKQTEAEQKRLRASLAPAKAALAAASSQVASIATTSYEQGRIGPVSAMLDGAGSNTMAKLAFLDQIQRANQRDITTYSQITQTYADRQAALRKLQAKQAAQLAALAARRDKIEKDIKNLRAMRTAAYGSPTTRGRHYTGKIPDIAGSAGVAVRYAYRAIGSPYQYGASGPHQFDCSGLTMSAWAAAGKSLPHNAAAQWREVAHISRSALKPGDLVFYRNLGHVGIYVGDDQIIDAPREGEPVDKRSINRGMSIYGYGRVT